MSWPSDLKDWASSGVNTGACPTAMPRAARVDLFEGAGFALVGDLQAPMGVGRTETLAFRKSRGASLASEARSAGVPAG